MTDKPKRTELADPLTNLMLATGKIKATNYHDIIEQGLNFIDSHSKAYTEIMAWHEQEIAEAKFGIVVNTLNLLNTEPIHTVEQALLGDMERLEAERKRINGTPN